MTYTKSDQMESFLKERQLSFENHHFTQIPCLIDHLTYIHEKIDKITGQKIYERKRLSVYAKELYRQIKSCTFANGSSYSSKHYANIMNCSLGTISNAKKELTQAFEQMEGKSLIRIEKIQKNKYNEKGNVHLYSYQQDKIFVEDHLWTYNNSDMPNIKTLVKLKVGIMDQKEAEIAIEAVRQSYEQKDVHNSGGFSRHEAPSGGHSPYEEPSQGGRSPHERNNIHCHIQNEYETYSSGQSDNSNQNASLARNREMIENDQDAYNFLIKFGIHMPMAKKIMKCSDYLDVKEAISTLIKPKKIKTKNIQSYVVSLLYKKPWKVYV